MYTFGKQIYLQQRQNLHIVQLQIHFFKLSNPIKLSAKNRQSGKYGDLIIFRVWGRSAIKTKLLRLSSLQFPLYFDCWSDMFNIVQFYSPHILSVHIRFPYSMLASHLQMNNFKYRTFAPSSMLNPRCILFAVSKKSHSYIAKKHSFIGGLKL